MPSYFLTSKRLGFRHWTQADSPLAQALWRNRQVTSLFGGPFSELQIKKRLEKEIEMQTEYGIQYWPVFVLDGGRHAGCAGLRPYNAEPRIYELGVHLLPDFWRQGIGEEAARAVIQFAFANTPATALFAGHHPNNRASRELLARLGFHYTHEELYQPTGEMHPSYLLARPIV